LAVVAGCGGSDPPPQRAGTPAPSASAGEATVTARVKERPRLRGAKPCPDVRDATCSTLRVPLDRSGERSEALDLRVAVAGAKDAPVLVILTGGPGEPALPFMDRARGWFGPETEKLRLVALDPRGTGAHALKCPALQSAMGASDLTPPPPAAVQSCAKAVGDQRRFFTTADTVADLEALRRALGVKQIALDGTSYGTYVAQRYALAHPDHVSRLVLDSVVPADGISLLSIDPIRAAERVLGEDTARDLATVVKNERNGPQMLDMLTGLSVGAPRGNDAPQALKAAAGGNTGHLEGLQAGVSRVMKSWTAEKLSQGLHASTLCADMPAPWGDASAPLEGRKEALEREAAKLTDEDLYPFDRQTATGNGIAQQCLNWPPVDIPTPDGPKDLPDVPVLLLAGTLDLSTPLEWAQRAAARAPGGKLVVVEGAGHGVQNQKDPEMLATLRAFVGALAG
jgi:pimeloyl-ACP methyl ester carboxylesterase